MHPMSAKTEKNIQILVFATTLSYNLSQYFLIPYLGYLSEHNVVISAALVGTALTIKTVAEKALLSLDVFVKQPGSATKLVTLGLVCRMTAVAIAFSMTNSIQLFLLALLMGVSGALIRPRLRALLTANSNAGSRKSMFSLMFALMNVGSIIGPLLLTLIGNQYARVAVFGILILIDLLLALQFVRLKAQSDTVISGVSASPAPAFRSLVKYPDFVWLGALQFIFWLQLGIAVVTLSTIDKFNGVAGEHRGTLFAAVGISAVFLQVLMARYKPLADFFKITFAQMLVFGGILLLILAPSIPVIYCGAIILGLGESILAPRLSHGVAILSEKLAVASLFSLFLLFESIGEIVGLSAFSFIMAQASDFKAWLIVFVAISFVLSVVACQKYKAESCNE